MTIAHTIALHPYLAGLSLLGAFGGVVFRLKRIAFWVRLACPEAPSQKPAAYAGWRGHGHH